MAWNTRHTSDGEEIYGAVDEGESDWRSTAAYSTPRIRARNSLVTEEPLPIFLSDTDDELAPPDVESRWEKKSGSSFFVKASICAAAAAAIAMAIVSVDNPLNLFASAKASLIGASSSSSSSARPPAPVVRAAVTAPVPVAPAAPAVAAPANDQPSREDIANAFKTARLVQPEIRQPSVAAPTARRIDAGELEALLKRAKSLMAIGDIASARLLLERAADAQEASAALLLGQTYDPVVLGKQDLRSITADPEQARNWYQKAAQLGSQDARQRLDQMKN
jgi:hypothetical protein